MFHSTFASFLHYDDQIDSFLYSHNQNEKQSALLHFHAFLCVTAIESDLKAILFKNSLFFNQRVQ